MSYGIALRIQDEIISEEDCEPESRSDVEDEINQERPALGDMQPINQPPVPPYYGPNTAPIQGTIPQVPPPHHHGQPPQHVLPPQAQPTPVPTVNGAIHPDEINVMPRKQFYIFSMWLCVYMYIMFSCSCSPTCDVYSSYPCYGCSVVCFATTNDTNSHRSAHDCR